MDDKALSQEKDNAEKDNAEKDNAEKDTLEILKTRINKEKKYTKKIQKKFDENEERKENENEKIIININLIAIIYKKNDDNYNFEFIIIKNNNEINIEKFNNYKSIYVYHDRSKIISKCNNFNKKFTNNDDVNNNFLNIIKKKSKNILYTLSYIFNDITYNIRLSIPIIIIITNVDRLIMIDYSNDTLNDEPNDAPNDIDLILLSIISKQLFRTITKYLKDNFETELDILCDKYYNNNIFNIIEVSNNDKQYRKSNNIDSIIKKNDNGLSSRGVDI